MTLVGRGERAGPLAGAQELERGLDNLLADYDADGSGGAPGAGPSGSTAAPAKARPARGGRAPKRSRAGKGARPPLAERHLVLAAPRAARAERLRLSGGALPADASGLEGQALQFVPVRVLVTT